MVSYGEMHPLATSLWC